MLRSLSVAVLFALSLTAAAQADTATSLNSRIEQAAEKVCAPLLDSRPSSLLYNKWFAECVTGSTAKITAAVAASRPTSTALLK
jgi:hypothetical protein